MPEVLVELEDLAVEFGVDLALDLLGVGEVGKVAEALATLLELVSADDRADALTKEGRSMAIEHMLASLIKP